MQFQFDFILPVPKLNQDLSKRIPGLSYTPNFIEQGQEKTIIQAIDQLPWDNRYKRRTQSYGEGYSNNLLSQTKPFPNWLKDLARELVYSDTIHIIPNQASINEYLPGQGIAAHTDLPDAGEYVIILNLGSSILMEFQHPQTRVKTGLLLEPCSLLLLQGEARKIWKHSIPARFSDTFNGQTFPRQRRLSIIFRKAIV